MSDDDTKKPGGYRLEYAASGVWLRPKPCSGSSIPKGALRLGSQVDFRGNTTFVWRHWGCVTPTILANFKKSFETPDELDGFEELKADDQERVRKAWEVGQVAEEDKPATALGEGGQDESEGDGEPKKKKKRAPPKKKAKKDDDDDDDDDDEKPKKKAAKKAPAKKAPAKKKATKKKKDESDLSGEDFGDDMDKVSGDEDDDGDDDGETGKKRKRAAPKKASASKKAPAKPKAKKPAAKKSKKAVSEDEAEDDD